MGSKKPSSPYGICRWPVEGAKKLGLEAASNGWDDGNRVASLHSGLETFHVADIVVADKDVHELVQIARGIEQALVEAWVGRIESHQNLAQGGAFHFNGGCTARDWSHCCGDSYGHSHAETLPIR